MRSIVAFGVTSSNALAVHVAILPDAVAVAGAITPLPGSSADTVKKTQNLYVKQAGHVSACEGAAKERNHSLQMANNSKIAAQTWNAKAEQSRIAAENLSESISTDTAHKLKQIKETTEANVQEIKNNAEATRDFINLSAGGKRNQAMQQGEIAHQKSIHASENAQRCADMYSVKANVEGSNAGREIADAATHLGQAHSAAKAIQETSEHVKTNCDQMLENVRSTCEEAKNRAEAGYAQVDASMAHNAAPTADVRGEHAVGNIALNAGMIATGQ